MIAPANTRHLKTPPGWQEKFLLMLPTIRQYASHHFRHRPRDERDDFVAEAVALAFAMFIRLVERGKPELGYATPLAVYACRQIAVGRRLGSPLNVRDVTSTYCQRRKGVFVERLDRFDVQHGEWQQIVVEDRKTTPADIAATRIHFSDWLHTLTQRQRRIAQALALGESTGRTARMFHISAGRVSQIRRELYDSWRKFQAEPLVDRAVATA